MYGLALISLIGGAYWLLSPAPSFDHLSVVQFNDANSYSLIMQQYSDGHQVILIRNAETHVVKTDLEF